jgi:23S rRNA (guanosine2251-2'-O)-methyltransferase
MENRGNTGSRIAGRKPVLEALRAGTQLERILILQGVHGAVIEEIRSTARQARVTVLDLRREEFRALADETTSQGVIAMTVSKKPLMQLDQLLSLARTRTEPGFLLILDEIEDPQNLGALIRTAECAGVHGVIVPKHHSAPVGPAAVKASAGATEHMAIAEVTNVVNAIEELKQEGFWIAGLEGSGSTSYTAADYTGPTALIVGNEGKGIRRLVKEHCDFLVSIPVLGKVSSLNASVAGALVMYEALRQRVRPHPHPIPSPSPHLGEGEGTEGSG